jgi:hypothetical protein
MQTEVLLACAVMRLVQGLEHDDCEGKNYNDEDDDPRDCWSGEDLFEMLSVVIVALVLGAILRE